MAPTRPHFSFALSLFSFQDYQYAVLSLFCAHELFFFCSLEQRRRKSLDGDYAPFGYIVQGWDVFNQLQPNDVISNTVVDEWGVLNLVKIRESRFSDVVASPSSEQEEEEEADTETTTTNNSSVSNES